MGLLSKCLFCDSVEDTIHVQNYQSTTPSNHCKGVLTLLWMKLNCLHTSPIVKSAFHQTLIKLLKEILIPQGQPRSGLILKLQEEEQQPKYLWNLVIGKWCLK